MTAVLKEKKTFIWQTCFHMTLLKFREAVIRKCAEIRRHYIHRRHTKLTGIVPEEERKKFGSVAKIELHGDYALNPALVAAISKAAADNTAAGG